MLGSEHILLLCVCAGALPPCDILGNTKPQVTMETRADLLTVKAETEGVCESVCVQCGWFPWSLCVCVCYSVFYLYEFCCKVIETG